jgi:hypothetical protein
MCITAQGRPRPYRPNPVLVPFRAFCGPVNDAGVFIQSKLSSSISRDSGNANANTNTDTDTDTDTDTNLAK